MARRATRSKKGNQGSPQSTNGAEDSNLFDKCGIENFTTTPDTEGDCAQFAKLFKQLSDKIESAQVQGFTWKQSKYGPENGLDETIEVAFDHDTYLVLAMRYREMFEGGGGLGSGGEVPFEIDTHLTSIDTGFIDAQYMESRFTKWMMSLEQENVSEAEKQELLDDLHATFSMLRREDQVLAEVLIHDIQGGDMQLEPGMTFRDCLNQYRQRTEDGRIDSLVKAFGIDKNMLVELVREATGVSDPNTYGKLDALRETIDVDKAKRYFEEVTGAKWKTRHVRMRADTLITYFIVHGDFDLDGKVVKRYGAEG